MKQPERFQAPRIRFTSEQDGQPERELKNRLAQMFRSKKTVSKAYLARVSFDGFAPDSVAVCICAFHGFETDIIEGTQQIFSSMFAKSEHLDIVFLNDAQEKELASCCQPFYGISRC
jgi:hypothetical protein